MRRKALHICLLTDAHISYNPRLVKEADALHQAGHCVRVIAVSNDAAKDPDDERILSEREWPCLRLNFNKRTAGGWGRWLCSGASCRMAYRVWEGRGREEAAARAVSRYYGPMLRAALCRRTDLYIGHNLATLPVAVRAAQAMGARPGFDVEDYHLDEDCGSLFSPAMLLARRLLMKRFLPQCSHVSCASESMADELQRELGIPRPLVLYNVFPLSHAAGLLPPQERPGRPDGILSAYWFSQMVGLDRGLQDFLRAMPLLEKRLELHLRGGADGMAFAELMCLAENLGVGDRIFLHPPIHAEEIVKDAAGHDLGLSLEQPVSRNRQITVPNKIFACLLAGCALVTSETCGQMEIMRRVPGAGITYRPGDHRQMAVRLNALFRDGRLMQARRESWEAARNSLNWDIEKAKLLEGMSGV